MIIKIKKRDGRTVTFNIEKIAGAIYKAAQSVGKDNYEEALELSGKVVDKLMENTLICLLLKRFRIALSVFLLRRAWLILQKVIYSTAQTELVQEK